jgi:hypothetical protein
MTRVTAAPAGRARMAWCGRSPHPRLGAAIRGFHRMPVAGPARCRQDAAMWFEAIRTTS